MSHDPASPRVGPDDPRAEPLHRLLLRAGEAARARRHALQVRRKDDGTEVTDADLAAHDVLVEGLSRLFPGETVRSEEGPGIEAPDALATWWVDPIDGTSAFVEGLGHWGPTVCRVVDGRLDVGAFLEPDTGTWWFAAEGGGAWRDDRLLHPPEPGSRRSLYLPSRAHLAGPIPWPGRIRALGSSAAHLAYVAAGGAAATIVPDWETWDVGCGILLVREAGRRIVDLSGVDLDPMVNVGQPFLAAADTVVDDLVERLRAALASTSREP